MRTKHFILALFILHIFFGLSLAQCKGDHLENKTKERSKEEIKQSIKETIAHHLLDAHYYEITHGVSFPLPIIIWDEGLHVFMSNKFNKGKTVVESKGKFYKLYHGKIYSTGVSGKIKYNNLNQPTNPKPLDFSITKNVFIILLTTILLVFIFSRVSKGYNNRALPSGFGRLVEPLIIFVRDDIAIPNIGKKHYKKYMSYLLTVFCFIWFINLACMTPLGINVTGNIAVTFALALVTFLITQFTANKNYWGHIFWMPGVPVPMKFILAPIELLGVFIKPFALMIRLYANISAGHIVLMSLIGLLFVFNNWLARGAFFGLTMFLGIIELLVAFLQAYIFTMLSALYFGFAVEEHHD